MAKGRKTTIESIEAKIEKKKLQLERSKARYEADKEALADLIKIRNEIRKGEIFDAIEISGRTYEEIMAFISGSKNGEVS